jgi:xanthine dehydrogenase accessory factor
MQKNANFCFFTPERRGKQLMNKLEQSLCQLLKKGERVVLATILSHAGSTPRTAGTKMLVCSDGKIIGTIGGGLVEAQVISAASEIFKTGDAQVRNFDLTNSGNADTMDVICGGRLKILLERMDPDPVNLEIFQNLLIALEKKQKSLLVAALPATDEKVKKISRCLITGNQITAGDFVPSEPALEKLTETVHNEKSPVVITIGDRRLLADPYFVSGTVYLFGAGHVSQQTAILTRMVDFRTVVLDDRAEFANRERFKDADDIRVLDSFEDAFSGLETDQDSYIVIVTRGHSHDKTVLEQALRTGAGYIGMIGSRRKRDAIYKALLQQGFTEEDLQRVHSPIGLKIGADTPEEIAVSIAAELIAVRKELSLEN